MNDASISLLVTADDTTGATEAGAACADAGWIVDVVPVGTPLRLREPPPNCIVVDLRSRHVTADEARLRMAASTTERQRVHKIDSTLRGNWSAELSVLAESGRRIVVVPSHPRVGRTCEGGVVYVNGVPLADSDIGNDPRLPVKSSRPRDSLAGVELAGVVELQEWIASRSSTIAIVDATTLDDIARLVEVALATPDIVLAGPASVVEVVARMTAPPNRCASVPVPWLPRPTLVVSASLHPASRAQVAAVARAGIDVVTSSEVRERDPAFVVLDVAERAHEAVVASDARSVILVGGDTAEAFVGDSVVRVFGSIDVGVSLGESEIRGRRLRVAMKPGGYGSSNTLVELVNG